MTYAGLVEQLITVGADATSTGLVLGTGGNLSVRGPGEAEFTVTTKGSTLGALSPETLSVMSMDGEVAAGADPSSEWRLHQQTYRTRSDVQAIVHLHPEFTVLLDAIGSPIRQLTLEQVAYASTVTRIGFYPNGSDELGMAAGAAAASADCVVMAHHGCSTVGSTPFEALRKAANLEGAARATYRLLLLGDHTTEFPQHLRASAMHG